MTRQQALAVLRATGLVAVFATSCSSTSTSSGSSSTIAGQTTIFGASTTFAGQTTIASTAPAPSTTIVVECDGAGGIPGNAELGATIYGDVDGDLAPDTITEYSLDGVPHVHSQLATGGESDAAVPIGNGDHVEISFIDFDYSLGAPTPPPLAVLAIGATGAGTASFTFLTNTIDYCIAPWHKEDGSMFVGRISAQPPFEGLFCDHAAGNAFNSLTTATADVFDAWNVSTRLLRHNFTLVTIDPPTMSLITGDEADIQAQYGDIVGCGHDPLFP